MKKGLVAIIIAAMLAAMLAACGGSGSSGGSSEAAPAAAASSAKSEAAAPAAAASSAKSEAAAPAAEAEEEINYLEELLKMDDGLALSGIQSAHQEDRSHVYKALDKIEKKDNVTLAFAGASLGAEFFVSWEKTLVREAEARGWTLLESNAQFDMELQNTQVDAFIQQGVDCIILNPVRLDAQADRIQAAVDAGIPVIVAGPSDGRDPESPVVTVVVAGANIQGYYAGEYAAEKLYDPAKPLKVGMALAFLSDASTCSRGCGFISGWLAKVAEINGNPYANRYAATIDGLKLWNELKDKGKCDATADWGIDFVGYGQGEGTDASAGQVAASDLITAHPDMDLIFVEIDQMVTGIISEIEQHSLVPNEDIKLICGTDGTEAVCEMIKEGTVMASALNVPEFYTIGIFTALDAMFTDKEVDFDINNLTLNEYNPTEMITQENIDEHYYPGCMFGTTDKEFEFYDVPGWNAANGGSAEPAPAAEESKSEAAAPAAEDGTNYLEELVAMNDGLSLSGIQSAHQEDRSDVYKALDKIEKKDDVTVAFAGASLGSDFFVEWERTIVDMAKERGWKLLESNAQFDMELQNTQVDSFIQQGVDVLILNAVRLDAQVDRVQAAVDAGIPVVVAGPTPGTPDMPVISTIISGSNLSGWMAGQFAAEQLYKPGEVAKIGFAVANISDADSNSRPCGFISGFIAYVAQQEGTPYTDRYAATIDGLKIWTELKNKGKYDASDKGVDFVGYGQGEGTDAAAGQVASSDLLTAHSDMDLIVVETDTMVTGVISEIEQHSLVPNEDIKIICCADGTGNVCQLIKDGVVLGSALNNPKFYSEGIFACLDAMFGDDNGLDVNNLCINNFCPTEMITQDNIDDYYEEGAFFGKAHAGFTVYDVPKWNAENE